MCREKAFCQSIKTIGLGSPLRVQGKANFKAIQSPPIRITPACAGKRVEVAIESTDD